MALGAAIVRSYGYDGTLEQYCRDPQNAGLRVLEINPAGMLTRFLGLLAGHRLIAYPKFDMMRLAIESASCDLVLHSDTLEHVSHPETALAECRRILDRQGRCIYTVPIVVGRMTRSRVGLPDSYHGSPGKNAGDLLVHTEFGADAWTLALRAGFASCAFHCLEYPAGLAIEAR